jgi:hypothetical protein
MATKKPISLKSIFYTAISLVWIFGLSAIGHITMVLIEKYNPAYKFTFAWQMALAGFVTIYLTRWMKSDGWQSFWGTMGGLGMWFAFEYSLMYAGDRMGVCYTWNGSYPEYALMKHTFFLLIMVFTYLMYQESVRCNFIFYLRRKLRLMRTKAIASGPVGNYGPRTAFEYIMVTWFFYVVLMIGYDPELFGPYSWFTYTLFFFSFGCFFYLAYKLLGYGRFGANLRYAIPTVTILWNDVEILAKWGMLKEPWVHINWPIMSVIIGGFVMSTYLIVKDLRKKKEDMIEIKDVV